MALSTEITAQLKQYLAKLNSNVVIEAFVDESEVSTNMSELLVELAEMTEKISLNIHKDTAERTPSFKINKPNETTGIQFAGIPLGHEFSSLVLALLQVGEHPLKISEDLVDQIKNIEGEFFFETFISLSCHNCPDVVQALNVLSLLNPNISTAWWMVHYFKMRLKEKK
jgi:alkyl hydroperoxide reductase subunit F